MLTLTYAVTREADRFGRDVGAVAANDAALLERADAAKRLRRRQPDARRQVDVGNPALVLDDVENLVVDCVEAGVMRSFAAARRTNLARSAPIAQ